MKRGGYLERSPMPRPTSTLQRREPIRRSRMKRAPAKRIAARAAMRPYLARVAKMPCAGEKGIEISGRGWRDHFCFGPVQVMHLGIKPGIGMKCPDDEVGAGCLGLHTDFDQHRGPFTGWSRDERREWADGVIASTRAAGADVLAEIVERAA